MARAFRLLAAVAALVGIIAGGGPVFAKAHHQHSGAQLLGNHIKSNGKHNIHKAGNHTVAVEVVNGKVAGVHVKHAKKGDVAVTKYKTKKKMAQMNELRAPLILAQYQDLGMTWIGYGFIDDYGDEQIYWFPYEMILDGDTGAIEYVPLT